MKNIVFDFDGVIFNSNKIKTEAFERVIKDLGLPYSAKLGEFNKKNGGITALEKFRYYTTSINPFCNITPQELEAIFRKLIASNLKSCEHDEYLNRDIANEDVNYHIISGGNKNEILDALEHKKLRNIFNGYLLANPDTKEFNFKKIKSLGVTDAVYIGDSKLDYELASRHGFSFAFIHQWTEVDDWKDWTKASGISSYKNLTEFFDNE